MENNFLINASLSTQNLTFTPGTTPASFTVTVKNDSNQFANFQIEITAAGEQRNPEYRWYKLEPEVAAAKPPGDSTDFQVFIINTPIPGFVGTVNLTITIFSPQLGQQRRLTLRLRIERDNQPTVLSLELPVQEFQVYPRNSVDIPVRVRNLGQQITTIILRFVGIDPTWLIGNIERRFSLDPGGYTEITFQCQPPSVVQSPCQNYQFTIEANSNNGYPASITGNLQVLPVGFVEFAVTNKHQKIPSSSRWLPNWKSDTATFELIFKNASNLYQEIDIHCQGRDIKKCSYKTLPETANLHLGETTKVLLKVKTKRPWLGLAKTLLLEAKSQLFDQRLGTTDPATQTLELRSLPIIPLWLQLMLLGLIAFILGLIVKPQIMHTGSVNSVAFNGNGQSVISGSNDCTLRFWNIDRNNNIIEPGKFSYQEQPIACGKTQKPHGLLAITSEAVSVSEFMPVNNDIIALGLDNGVIELRQVSNQGKEREQLQDQDSKAIGDRVFDLEFTKDSRYLFSGYGSGKVRLWSKVSTSPNSEFEKKPQTIDIQNQLKLPFQSRTLTLSSDDRTLVIGGNFTRFLFGYFNSNQANKFPNLNLSMQKLDSKATANDFILSVHFLPNPQQQILATADSGGSITIWDLNKCKTITNISSQNSITEVDCQKLDSWQGSKMAVRTLKFNENGRFLVSGGDDGKVILWYLNQAYQLDKTKAATGQTIYQSSKIINSIDLMKDNMIVSGGEDFQVKLHRIEYIK